MAIYTGEKMSPMERLYRNLAASQSSLLGELVLYVDDLETKLATAKHEIKTLKIELDHAVKAPF